MFPADFQGDYATPRIVAELADGRPAHAVWCNEIGGVTFQLGEGESREFLKWTPHGSGVDLDEEMRRLRWAVKYVVVPRVIEQGADDEGSWFLTAGLRGTTAVDERWKREPAMAVRAIGAGLRALHDALPPDECPFDWSAEHRIARVADRDRGLVADIPAVDRLVVCHGDACSPNTLLDEDGNWCAHVDLDALGVADRWADLAVATLATTWNYGPNWTEPLLAAYGVEPDWERIAYYRRLWNLT